MSADDTSTALELDGGYVVVTEPFDEVERAELARASEAHEPLDEAHPALLEEPGTELSEIEPMTPIDKAVLVGDGTLSCSSIPSRTCPGVTLRMANRSISFSGFSLPLSPPVPVQEVARSGSGMRAGIDLDTISCGLTGGEERIFTEEIELRLPTETVLTPAGARSVQLRPPGRANNYPQAGELAQVICPNPNIGILAPGFEPRVVRATGEFLSSRRVTDDQTRRDGTARFFIRCGFRLDRDAISIERSRPRDILSVSGNRFVTGESLSSSQRRSRCSAMCHDDCAVQFGADALGADACTQVCTGSCVSESTSNLSQCPAPPASCTPCQSVADCGGTANDFQCTSGCCSRVIR